MSFTNDDVCALLGYLHRVHEEGPFITDMPDNLDDMEEYKLTLTPGELGYITGMLAHRSELN